jgi:uncharacterized membrane protein YhhN
VNLLSWAILASGVLAIATGGQARHKLFYLFKPLTTVLICILAVMLLPEGADRNWLLAALAFCLLGDVALMRQGDVAFAVGLAAFLVGHGLFVGVFLNRQAVLTLPVWWPLLAVYAVGMLAWLLPKTGKLAPAVLLYVAAIMGMALSAGSLAAGGLSATVGWQGKPLVLLGALLFVVSDTLLAVDRFVKPFAAAHGLILATYYSALWCMVMGSLA